MIFCQQIISNQNIENLELSIKEYLKTQVL